MKPKTGHKQCPLATALSKRETAEAARAAADTHVEAGDWAKAKAARLREAEALWTLAAELRVAVLNAETRAIQADNAAFRYSR